MLMEFVTPDFFPKFEGFETLFTFNTQLLSSLTICRHGLHLKFMAFIMDTSETAVETRIKITLIGTLR